MRRTAIIGVGVCILVMATLLWSAPPTTAPASDVYINGDVVRPGAYVLSLWSSGGGKVSVLAAIDAASPTSKELDYELTIFHRINAKLQQTTRFNSLKALREVPQAVPELQAGDIVSVKTAKAK